MAVNEDGSEAQPFAGRLMNLQVELCAWRENLPPHLKFDKGSQDPENSQWETVKWVKRQRQSIQVRK